MAQTLRTARMREPKRLVLPSALYGPMLSLVLQSLDIQYTVGLATDVPVSFLSVGAEVYSDDEFASALIDTASYMLNQSSPPQVITTSYGDDESYISQNLA